MVFPEKYLVFGSIPRPAEYSHTQLVPFWKKTAKPQPGQLDFNTNFGTLAERRRYQGESYRIHLLTDDTVAAPASDNDFTCTNRTGTQSD